MILCIFEGGKREPRIFQTIKDLFFPKSKDTFICTYNSNIYSLYKNLKNLDIFGDQISSSGDTVTILNEILKNHGDNTLETIIESDISEIFLFFDYDFQDSRLSLEENNLHLLEMINYFQEETENGKLYISYPMIEAIQYTKQLFDVNYWQYKIKREDCRNFKYLVHEFSFYKSLDYLVILDNENESEESKNKKAHKVRCNWCNLIALNTMKANYICNNSHAFPLKKEQITQKSIFEKQLQKYVSQEECTVSILSAFPIFLYEYFKEEAICCCRG